MQPQFPGVAIGLYHLGLASQVVVFIVRHVPAADEGLEIRPELHPVGRIEVDHLCFPGHPLVLEQRIHHHQRVAENEAVHPVVLIFVGLQHLLMQRTLPTAKERVEEVLLLIVPVPGQRVENGPSRETLVDEQGQCRHVEGKPLRLARPVQERTGQAGESPPRLANLVRDLMKFIVPFLRGGLPGDLYSPQRLIGKLGDQILRQFS